MSSSARTFSCIDPFGTTWEVMFLWHQVGIAIRHADTIDCKFHLSSSTEETEKVVAIPHLTLKEFAQAEGREITDGWVIKLASAHVRYMIESGEDMDKVLVTIGTEDLRRSQTAVAA